MTEYSIAPTSTPPRRFDPKALAGKMDWVTKDVEKMNEAQAIGRPITAEAKRILSARPKFRRTLNGKKYPSIRVKNRSQ